MASEGAKTAGSLWNRLSPRERTLAFLTGTVVAAFLLFTVVSAALASLSDMDREIVRLQDDIINCANQMARREAVEAQYAKVAAQHSSAWTDTEIHERLRQEIYRLAKSVPPPLDENGIAVASPDNADNLVEIPGLGKGEMAEGGTGFRQYRIPLRIPATGIKPIIDFLERLQQSPQSLRLDKLELYRVPESDQVAASVVITRTIANGAAPDAAAAGNKKPVATAGQQNAAAAAAAEPPEGTGRIPLSASDWKTEGCKAELVETAGAKPYLEIKADTANATAELARKMAADAAYEAVLEMSATGKAQFGMAIEGNKAFFPDSAPLNSDGARYRYRVEFGIPAEAAGDKVACPRLVLQEAGMIVQIHNLVLRKMAE